MDRKSKKPDTAPMAVGKAIREARESRSQDAVAAALGVRQATVSRWETGENPPTFDDLAALEDFLKTPRGTILRAAGYVEDPTSVEDAIRGDPELTPTGRRYVLRLYSAAVDESRLARSSNASPSKRKRKRS